jgi:nucleotide-binding universal stress UspA family protein
MSTPRSFSRAGVPSRTTRPSTRPTTPYQAHGHGAFELIKTAKEVAADLVVVGATRHGLIERFLIGSVSYEVATHAPCSVLVVRP